MLNQQDELMWCTDMALNNKRLHIKKMEEYKASGIYPQCHGDKREWGACDKPNVNPPKGECWPCQVFRILKEIWKH